MEVDTYAPTFLIQIEGQLLSRDITYEITSFVFEDREEELDLVELRVANREGWFTDDPLFQEGNEIVARFGYAGQLSPRKVAVIKEIDYDFPEGGVPSIRIKAFDKGFMLAATERQRVWAKPAPGITYSEIAVRLADEYGLKPVVTPTITKHLRVTQGNINDAKFLFDLASQARSKGGECGYVFYVEDEELHFHPRSLDQKPLMRLEYFTDRSGLLRSFNPSTQSQGASGAGVETRAIGVDPRKKKAVEHRANNESIPERKVLGDRTYLVDANTGEGRYTGQQSGKIVPSYGRSEGFIEEPNEEPAKTEAESRFKSAEMLQVEATAVTVGIPLLRAKRNIEIAGVGRKFSGIYYCKSVRHTINESGYSCELKLRRNALGSGAGENAAESKGRENRQEAPRAIESEPPQMVRIDADTGEIIQ